MISDISRRSVVLATTWTRPMGPILLRGNIGRFPAQHQRPRRVCTLLNDNVAVVVVVVSRRTFHSLDPVWPLNGKTRTERQLRRPLHATFSRCPTLHPENGHRRTDKLAKTSETRSRSAATEVVQDERSAGRIEHEGGTRRKCNFRFARNREFTLRAPAFDPTSVNRRTILPLSSASNRSSFRFTST